MRFLILNKVLAQDLIEIIILEQSHWDSQWEKQKFFCKGILSMLLGSSCSKVAVQPIINQDDDDDDGL